MGIRKEDVDDLLRAHGITPVAIVLRERQGQRPALLSVTLGCEASAKRLYSALRTATRLEIGKGTDEAGRFVVTMFGANRY